MKQHFVATIGICIFFLGVSVLYSSVHFQEKYESSDLVLQSSNSQQCPPNKDFLISKQTEIKNTYTEAEIEEARRKILAEMQRRLQAMNQQTSNTPYRRYVDPEQLIRDVRLLMSIEDSLKKC